MISKETEAEVLRLFHAEKWRIGTIASELGLHHTTIQRVLRQSGIEPRAIAPRPSMADPFLERSGGLGRAQVFPSAVLSGTDVDPSGRRRLSLLVTAASG